MHRYLVVLVVIFAMGSGYAKPPQPTTTNNGCTKHDKFPLKCNPFGSASQKHPIDNVCGVSGDATEQGDQIQDSVKNNLCASTSVHEVTISDLKSLQSGVDESGLKYGNRHVDSSLPPPPVNREEFFEKEKASGLGEGDTVFFIGYIAEAKPGSPETVNCHCTGALFNDIHVALADHPLKLKTAPANASAAAKHRVTVSNDAALCTNSFTAEVSPHLRPAVLTRARLDALKDKSIVKITGQIFFDASHHPCKGTAGGSEDPARFTSWEIHPVYAVDVCKKSTLAECRGDDPSVWKALQ